jgi:predicted Zn-dependent protease
VITIEARRITRPFTNIANIARGAILSVCLASPVAAQIRLPDIGESSAGSLSGLEEDTLGEAFLREIRAHLPLLEDVEVLSYIRTMGDKLVSQTEGDGLRAGFRFFVVDSPTVNAFAGPGGIIAVNAGLITLTTNEGELASVVAHEIAHVTQRHLARAIESSERSNPFKLAGLLAALVLATQNAEAGQAAAASVIAGSVQKRLDFTRQNEQEADRVGIGLLARAGFDPRAMPTFFERLQHSNRFYSQPPEFLSTHPVTVNRVSDSRARAEQFPYKQYKDSIDYLFVKAKVLALSIPDEKAAVEQARATLRAGLFRSEAATRYGLGVALMRAKQWEQAREQIDWLTKRYPERIALQDAIAQIERHTGAVEKAEKIYVDALRLYPYDELMTHSLADLLAAENRPREVVNLLEAYTRAREPRSSTYDLLSQGYAGLNRPMEANAALAERYFTLGDVSGAIHQLSIALDQRSNNEYATERAQARREELLTLQRQRAAVKRP